MSKRLLLFVFFLIINISFVFGKSILFLRDGQIYSYDMNKKTETVLFVSSSTISYYEVSPNKKYLAFETTKSDSQTNTKVSLFNIKTNKIIDIQTKNVNEKIYYWDLDNNLILENLNEKNEVTYTKFDIINLKLQDLTKILPYPIFDNKGGIYYTISRGFDAICYLPKGKTINTSNLEYLYIKSMHNIVFEEKTNRDVDLYLVNFSTSYNNFYFFKKTKILDEKKQDAFMYELAIFDIMNKTAKTIYSDIDRDKNEFSRRVNRAICTNDTTKILFSTSKGFFHIFDLTKNDHVVIEGENYKWIENNQKILYNNLDMVRTIDVDGRNNKILIKNAKCPTMI